MRYTNRRILTLLYVSKLFFSQDDVGGRTSVTTDKELIFDEFSDFEPVERA